MVNILEIKRPIIVWGTGLFGVKCMYDILKRDLHIKYFLNNDCKIESFCNIPVYEPNQDNIKNVFIIVATKISTYSIISEQLTSMGLEEFKDYVFYPWINKKVVLLHGNCHLDVIEEYLSSSEKFCKLYSIYPNPRICNNSQNKIGDNILANCDVWIHEDIKEDNPFGYFLSDEYISTKMKKDIINITIPNLFGLGKAFFPQAVYSGDIEPSARGFRATITDE